MVAILVDTNVLFRHTLRNRLTEKIEAGLLQVYFPTLVHAERIRQLADEKGETFALDLIRQAVIASRFEPLPFEMQDAEAIGETWLTLKDKGYSDQEWQKYKMNVLLCAVARSRGYPLLTDDKGDHFDILPHKLNSSQLDQWLEHLQQSSI